jgi:hypothetical protein
MKAIPVRVCFDCDEDPGWACECREHKDGQYVPGRDCPLPDVPEVPDGLLPNPLDAITFVQKLRGMK